MLFRGEPNYPHRLTQNIHIEAMRPLSEPVTNIVITIHPRPEMIDEVERLVFNSVKSFVQFNFPHRSRSYWPFEVYKTFSKPTPHLRGNGTAKETELPIRFDICFSCPQSLVKRLYWGVRTLLIDLRQGENTSAESNRNLRGDMFFFSIDMRP